MTYLVKKESSDKQITEKIEYNKNIFLHHMPSKKCNKNENKLYNNNKKDLVKSWQYKKTVLLLQTLMGINNMVKMKLWVLIDEKVGRKNIYFKLYKYPRPNK